MSSTEPPEHHLQLSVVIASYNSAPWLPSTLQSLAAALAATTLNAEVVIVDDGSTDSTASAIKSISDDYPVPMTVVSQENKGRFLARWAGVQAARHEHVLILDSRLIVHEQSLAYLQHACETDPTATVWNGHVVTDPTAPLVGQFWSVPTHIFWSEYLAAPRQMNITADNFDRVPKGTGFLFLSKELFEQACLEAWPTENAHLVSDDTKLLRFVVGKTPIRLDPGFSATYRPRTSVSQFLAHGRERGTLFVDSYAGTSGSRNIALILLAIVPPLAVLAFFALALASLWPYFWGLFAAVLVALAIPAMIAACRRCPPRAILSYFTYVLPFGVLFWSGLVRGLKLHRKSFTRASQRLEGPKN